MSEILNEALSDPKWIPEWNVGISTVKRGESINLEAGSTYEVLYGEGTGRSGMRVTDNVTSWSEKTFGVKAGIRRFTLRNPTDIIQITATSDLLGIIQEPTRR